MNRRDFVKLTALGAALHRTSVEAAAAPAAGGPLEPASPIAAARSPEAQAAALSPWRDPQTGFTFYSPLSADWYRGGHYFEWQSTTTNNRGRRVRVFYRTFGDRAKPALVLLHGYPTSSFDFREMVASLEADYFVAVLDFPGFGFSDKPQDGYSYMLADDARLVDHFVRDVLRLRQFRLLTHDRGGSVGFAFLGNYLDRQDGAYEIVYHFISNGGLFLALANLGQGQTDLLDPERGPAMIRQLKARPRMTQGAPETVAYADIEAFNDGIGARLHVGKYLLERAANEYDWLANLQRSPIPTALIWGLQDNVNPIRIGNYIWTNYLDRRAVESTYWVLPTAGHYAQRDAPVEMAGIVRTCLSGSIPPPGEERAFMLDLARARTPRSPVYIGRSVVSNVFFPGAVRYTRDGYL